MPGELLPDAECPKCLRPLAGLVDTTRMTKAGNVIVTRELYHMGAQHAPPSRKRPCVQRFRNLEKANAERRALEVPR